MIAIDVDVVFIGKASVSYQDDLPVFNVPLSSKKELCQFTLNPCTQTVGDFMKFIKQEDEAIDRVVFQTEGSISELYPLLLYPIYRILVIHIGLFFIKGKYLTCQVNIKEKKVFKMSVTKKNLLLISYILIMLICKAGRHLRCI